MGGNRRGSSFHRQTDRQTGRQTRVRDIRKVFFFLSKLLELRSAIFSFLPAVVSFSVLFSFFESLCGVVFLCSLCLFSSSLLA